MLKISKIDEKIGKNPEKSLRIPKLGGSTSPESFEKSKDPENPRNQLERQLKYFLIGCQILIGSACVVQIDQNGG